MARRPTKLQVYEHRVTRPCCRANATITSLMEVILAARRTCPVSKTEMLIDNGKAVKMPGESAKKPSKHPLAYLQTEELKKVVCTPEYGLA